MICDGCGFLIEWNAQRLCRGCLEIRNNTRALVVAAILIALSAIAYQACQQGVVGL